jgi:SAM-dependent methyltransferase
MDVGHETTEQQADEQAALWNGPAGRAWVDAQEVLDRIFKPFEELLVGELRPGSSVLDVGCGTGGTTLAAARRLGPGGRCVGIDVSEPMIALARDRAERERSSARFIRADAQAHAFEPATFDVVLSRFGVMFFSEPVGAFANLRHATREDGRLRFVAWRGAEENPFMTTAERAAAPLLPGLPARRPDGPGQFGFADDQLVRTILERSGWREVDVWATDVACTLPEHELVGYLNRLGPVGRALQDADPDTRAHVVAAVRKAFDPFVQGSEVRWSAACWLVGARA